MPPKEQSKAALKAQKAKAKKEKQLLDAKIKECEGKCEEAKGFLEPVGRNAEPNYVKAKASLDAAIEAYDASFLPYFLLGQLHRMQGMYTEAVESYSRALDVDSASVQTLEWRGHCYQALRDYPHALEDNTSIISLDPENDHAYNMRGLCVLERCVPGLRLRSADFDACVRDFSTAIRLNEASYYAMANLGKTYEIQGFNDKAIECYGRALRVNEAYPYAKFRRGCTALRMAESIILSRQQQAEDSDEASQEAAESGAAPLPKDGEVGAGGEAASRATKAPAARNAAALIEAAKAEVRQQFEQEREAQTAAQLLRVAESDFTALMDPNPDANKAAADVMVVLNIGICALLRKDVKKASEYLKLTHEIVAKRPSLVADGEAQPIENADTIKQVLAIRQAELKREKDRIRSAAA